MNLIMGAVTFRPGAGVVLPAHPGSPKPRTPMPLDPDTATDVAVRHGLTMADAVALRALTDDADEADTLAAKFAAADATEADQIAADIMER